MRPDGLTVGPGQRHPAHEIAAIVAAISTLLDEEDAVTPADQLPAAYRSAWRSEGIRDALDAGTVR